MKFDFKKFIKKTEDGEVDIHFYIDCASNLEIPTLIGSSEMRTYPEDNDTFAEQQNKIWHTIFPNYVSDFVEIGINLNEEQIRDDAVRDSDFEMYAMRINFEPGDKLR